MRKLIGSVALVGLVASAAVYAASDNHAAPGTPGDKNCVGQTMAYLAQVGASADVTGIGNIAKLNNLTVQEVKAIVVEYCAAP